MRNELNNKLKLIDIDQHHALTELEATLSELNKSAMGRRAFLAAMPLLLNACASTKKSRYREGNNKGQKTSLSVRDEIKMSNEYAPKMAKDYPALKDPVTQKYINKVGRKIIQSNNLEGKPYHYQFTVVQSRAVNAFALPAGKVYVTTPLIAMAETEAELAGVIGHEIGHIKARHTAERLDRAKKEESKSILYGLGGAIGGLLVGAGLGKILCSKNDRECLQRAATYGAAAGAMGGLLIQKYSFMANSREDEMEADRIGFRTSVASHYHKDYVGRFYSKLLVMEQKYKKNQNSVAAGLADAMSTHPPSKERVTQMNQMAHHQKLQKGSIISTKEFEQIKRRIS